jgi:hypothetical protein
MIIFFSSSTSLQSTKINNFIKKETYVYVCLLLTFVIVVILDLFELFHVCIWILFLLFFLLEIHTEKLSLEKERRDELWMNVINTSSEC